MLKLAVFIRQLRLVGSWITRAAFVTMKQQSFEVQMINLNDFLVFLIGDPNI